MKKFICKFLALALAISCLFSEIPVLASSAAPVVSYKSTAEDVLAVNSNAKEIYHFLIYNMGLNSAAACGILANIRRESYFNPDQLGDNDTSYGICQWHDTAPGVGRYTNLINWCTANGYDYTLLDGQLHFLQYELSQNDPTILHNGKIIYDYMLTVENTPEGAYTAGYYWCDTFEVPFSNNPQRRMEECDARGTLARDTYWPAYCEPTVDDAVIVAEGIRLNWEAFDGTYQYELYRYANGDPSTITLITATTETSALDSSVESGNNYTYMLCAVLMRADGTTYTANAKEITKYYLAAPTITKITGYPTSQKVKWKKVNGATQYVVYRSENDGEFVPIGTTASTSYKDTTAITPEVRYSYQIYAGREAENEETLFGLSSNTVGTYTLAQPVISGITNESDGIKLQWKKVPKAKYYTVHRSVNGGSYEEIATVTKKSFIDTEADNNGTVKYKIYAYYSGKSGQLSKSKASEAVSTFYLKAPKISSVTSSSGNSITPKWSRNTKATGYEIQYCKDSSFKSQVTTLRIVTNDTISWRIRGLTKGKTYYVRVRSYLTTGGKKYYSAYSTVKKCKVK